MERAAIVVAIIVFVSAAASFFLIATTQQPKGITTGTAATLRESPHEFVSEHLEAFGRRDVAMLLNNYEGDAELVWSGESGGLAGRYRGVNTIRAFLTTVLTNSDKVVLRQAGMNSSLMGDGTSRVEYELEIEGHNSIIGRFVGRAYAVYVLKQTSEGWRIKLENWDFREFEAEGQGATVFPQWSALYSRRADIVHDSVKDFFWNLSLLAPYVFAALILGLALSIFFSAGVLRKPR